MNSFVRFLGLFAIITIDVMITSALSTSASDWPQFLGPTRNAVYPGKDLADTWPAGGPPVIWRRAVGQGFSGPVVSNGKLILFHRLQDKEVIECLEAKSGKTIWTNSYATAYRDDFGFDEGPRATPAVSDGRVYCFGAEGRLSCFDFRSGTNVWTVDAKRKFRAPKGFFGMACSPLVDGNAVVMIIGAPGAGIVAFDRTNGAVLWKITDDAASYSSPVTAQFGGRQATLFLTRSELVGANPANGDILFRFPFEPPIHSSVSAATPVVFGNEIFLSASYETGAALLRVAPESWKLQKEWGGNAILSSHYATSIYRDGFLYGLDGRTDPGLGQPTLRCVDAKSGKVRWRHDMDACTLTLAGDDLLILTERGELIRALASADGYKEKSRAQILSSQVRAHPALAGGKLYARSKDMLICVELAPKERR